MNRPTNFCDLNLLQRSLEDKLSEDIEQLHFTVMDWVPGGAVQVAIIARQTLGDYIQEFENAGVTLDAIVPEHSLLPIHVTAPPGRGEP